MLSEVDSDDGPAFPMVGEGDDVSHFSSDGVVPDLEAELAADEECSRAVAFAGDSYDDRDGSDQSMFLPIDEPTAGDSSNAVRKISSKRSGRASGWRTSLAPARGDRTTGTPSLARSGWPPSLSTDYSLGCAVLMLRCRTRRCGGIRATNVLI